MREADSAAESGEPPLEAGLLGGEDPLASAHVRDAESFPEERTAAVPTQRYSPPASRDDENDLLDACSTAATTRTRNRPPIPRLSTSTPCWPRI
jgi:hypothetical protein